MSDCQRFIINTKVNSAFHPSRIGKSSTGLPGAFTCIGWQVIMRDPLWQMTLRSSEMIWL